MIKSSLLRMARKALEELPGELQEAALLRAIGVPVLIWDRQSCAALLKIIGSCRAICLLNNLA